MRWVQLDHGAQIVLERDEEQRRMFMGDAPSLDPVLAYVIGLYWSIRGGTPGDEPIHIGLAEQERTDPLLLMLLRTADSEFLKLSSQQHERRMSAMKAKHTAKKPAARPNRLH
jgi:hypothetical protein